MDSLLGHYKDTCFYFESKRQEVSAGLWVEGWQDLMDAK